MKLTIVVPDSVVGINGEFRNFEFGIAPDIRAVQWDGAVGHIEFNDGKPNAIIQSIAPFQDIVDLWIALTPTPPEPPTLTELKAAKNVEINTARLKANQTVFLYQGKQVACDQLSRSDIDGINGFVATRGALPNDWVGGWKALDNSIIPIQNITIWNAFYDSMIAQGQANFLKSQNLKAQLAAATTSEQIEAIVW
jgi:hypothetical protein